MHPRFRIHAGSTRLLLPASALALALALAGCGERQPGGDAHTDAPATAEVAAHHADADAAPAADAHDAHAAHGADVMLPAPPATLWASDAPLREGMRRMHVAVDALAHAEHGQADPAQVTAAAGQVLDAADYMFANCKLEPEPDVALHSLLAVLMKGATTLKDSPADLSPVAGMREALALYPRMFVDPDWQADTAPPAG